MPNYNFPKPGYVRLNVRCCCTPWKILGTLDLPAKYAHEGKIAFPVAPPGFDPWDRNSKPNFSSVTITLRTFAEIINGERIQELAVYSEERPQEFWKRFPSFNPIGPSH